MSERITATMEEERMDEHDSETQRVLHEQRKEVADQIATQLGETEVEPRKTVYRAVKKLGRDQALHFVQRALEIESTGGLMVPDQSRRRTVGGVFFFLIKTEIPADVTRHIFPRRLPLNLIKKKTSPQESQEATSMTPPAAPEAKPAAPPFAWEDRIAALAEIAIDEQGEVKNVKVTLIGRPGKIVERGQSIVTTMQQQPKLPPLPKGLPIPALDQIEPTLFEVYIATKQWRKVEEAIKDADDLLIVEGVQLLDKQLPNAIAVFASNVTTKKLQAAVRKTAPPQK
jgi:PHAX RNA-binding domain